MIRTTTVVAATLAVATVAGAEPKPPMSDLTFIECEWTQRDEGSKGITSYAFLGDDRGGDAIYRIRSDWQNGGVLLDPLCARDSADLSQATAKKLTPCGVYHNYLRIDPDDQGGLSFFIDRETGEYREIFFSGDMILNERRGTCKKIDQPTNGTRF